jgi:hypothetical protein
LTRVVAFSKRVYQSASSDAEVIIEYCDENNYPVTGIDIWTLGRSALPAGMFTVRAQDKAIIAQLIDAVRDFNEKTRDDMRSAPEE